MSFCYSCPIGPGVPVDWLRQSRYGNMRGGNVGVETHERAALPRAVAQVCRSFDLKATWSIRNEAREELGLNGFSSVIQREAWSRCAAA